MSIFRPSYFSTPSGVWCHVLYPKFFYCCSLSNASGGGKHQFFGIYITIQFGGAFSKWQIHYKSIYRVCNKKQLEVVEYITKFTEQFIHNLMNIPGNTAFLRLITFNYKITINQLVQMIEAIYNYVITNQKGRDILLLCKKFYSQQPCTFESGVRYLESV